MEESLSKFTNSTGGINGESSSKAGELLRILKGKRAVNNVAEKVAEAPVPFPIAIVGMGMRLPGGVSSGKEFWDFLVNKKDGHCPVPESRYNIEGFYDLNREGSIRTKHAYFLQHDIAQLDTNFFGLSKIEAGKLDPQQRLLLEVVWECMENAGQVDWQGDKIGCYVGVFGEDWLDLQAKDTQLHDRYRVMSSGDFALSNRVSFEYDLQGPSITIRTGCSSSMVGLHEACQALYSGECSSAIVAGTSLIMSPTMSTTMSDNMVISPSGICRTFDAAADGYGRGEAINVIYIKPLSDALENGDPIRAIIRATTVNCDGRTPSITTPGSEAQERLIRRAYGRAGIEEDCIGQTAFFECHGTGTIVGDTAEASVVANIFGKDGIYMGAVKPNVGHSEGASGITSVIKCVLALEKETIPPNVHFRNPSPKIPFERAKIQVPVEPTPWPVTRSRRVSVNSFGIGGTNAHVILESALEWNHDILASIVGIQKDICRLLLSVNIPIFKLILDELSKSEENSRVSDAEFAQPLCTAIQVGLVNLLQTWGISPEAVIGHSSGEIAAAYASGAISAHVAIILSYFRGQAVKAMSTTHSGAMAAVALAPEEVRPYLKDGISIACENSPQSVTLSGDADLLDAILSEIHAKDVFCRKLVVDVAYHSYHMEEARKVYETLISPYISFNSSMVPFYSTVTTTSISDPNELKTDYWGENLERPVLFSSALRKLMDRDRKLKILLEIGPHSALAGPIRQIIHSQTEADAAAVYVRTLQRETSQCSSLMQTAGHLYTHGVQLQLSPIIPKKKVVTDIPPYSWQHEDRFWSETRMVHDWRLRCEPHHELLGSRTLESSDIEPSWRNMLQLVEIPWLGDHRIGGDIIFPCAGYVAMVGEAIRQTTGSEKYCVKNLFMRTALVLDTSSTTEIITHLRPSKISDNVDSIWYDFSINAYHEDTWRAHCIGQVRAASDKERKSADIKIYSRPIQSKKWYDALEKRGLEYGAQFRRLENISASPSTHDAAAIVKDEDGFYVSHYSLHPIVIDVCLQLLSVAATNGIPRRMTRLCIPLALETLYVGIGRGPFSLDVSCDAGGGSFSGRAKLTSKNHVVLSLQRGLFFGIQDPETSQSKLPITSTLHWTPDVDFLSPESLLPHYSGYTEDGKILSLMTNVFIIETYLRTKGSAPKAEHLQKWLARLRKEYTSIANDESHLLPEARDAFMLTDDERKAKITELEVICKDAGSFPAYRLFKRVLDSVDDLLEERVESIDLLMEDGGLKAFYDVQAAELRWGNFLTLLGHSNPGIRVLEIGGGTGGDTAVALSGLASDKQNWLYAKYTFTDISPGFLGEAKERFKSYGNMDYKTLDISQDPMEQGFEEESYDLVIASNVIHATPIISKTLGNIKRLLAPGGRLFMIELTCISPFIEYIMGILPGWWLGEADGRSEKPYVTVQRWQKELLAVGFTGIDVFRYDNPEPYHINAHILTGLPTSRKIERDGVCLVFKSKVTEWARELAAALSSSDRPVCWYTMDQPPPSGSNVISVVDLEGPFLHSMNEEDFNMFRSFISSIEDSHLLWITPSIQARCEDPRCEITPHVATLELDKIDHSSIQPEGAENPPELPRFHWSPLNDYIKSSRGLQDARCLDIDSYAMLDTLNIKDDEVEVDIKYVGLNFRDMMILMGFMSSTAELGIEASGVVHRTGAAVKGLAPGDRVIVAGTGLICTRKTVPSRCCLRIPSEMSLEDAATVICVFATVIYSLLHIAKLKKGQSVLIHSACGGVGLAAIQICQMKEAHIYATVGNEDKAQHLISNYGICRDHIFDSRSSSFLEGVMNITNGKGVDIVLNSLSGELLHASWRCVASLGKMIELGKRDFLGHGKLDMDLFAENRSFIGIDLLGIMRHQPGIFREMSQEIVKYFKQGKLRPIRPVHLYDATNAEKGFRYMQSGQHMGKIVIKMPNNPADLPMARMHEAASYFPPDVSFLLVGGLGGLGRAVATWMAEKGAKHIVFLSPAGSLSAERQNFINNLQSQGCSAVSVTGSVANIEDVERAVTAAVRPIAGVIQLSMVLRDQGLLKMSYDEWTAAVTPKVKGTWNLHKVLKNASLEFFVLVSSITGLYGWPGQANYGAANTFLDAFVKYRQSLGMVASVIDLGLMADIGYVSETARAETFELARSNALQILEERQLLQGLEAVIFANKFDSPRQVAVGLGTTSLAPKSDNIGKLTKDKRFSIWKNILSSMDQAPASPKGDQLRVYLDKLKENPGLLDEPGTEAKIIQELGKLIASYTSSSDEMSQDDYANIVIDSLMTFEIRTWFRGHANIEISLGEVSNAGTVGGLAKVAIKKLREKYHFPQAQDWVGEGTSQHTEDEEERYRDDIKLGRAILPITGSVPDWLSESEGRVFLTGATGFVGAFFLEQLMRLSQVQAIACLVRTKDPESGMARIKETFRQFGLSMDSRCQSKVTVVPGDCTKELLDLSQEAFARMAEWSSVIFHFGAYSNYLLPYSMHRNANVLGLLEILRFANSRRLKAIHYCSSISACGLPENSSDILLEDSRPLLKNHEFKESIGYTRSKFVGENIMWNAIENGFPISIYRPSVITGHSVTGVCKDEDMINRLFSNCLRVGAYPRPPDHPAHLIPIDFVCAAILTISSDPNSIGHAFNVIQPDQSDITKFEDAFEILNRLTPSPMRCVSSAEWIEKYSEVKDIQVRVRAHLVAPQLSQRSMWWDNWSYAATYSTENLQQALADRPDVLKLKPMPELLEVYYKYWTRDI
ncbi:hypothetical protein BDV59DRAFT_212153 [Aspergillus ambiguus]|uniref:uncharacterized protein n=1 Tax=Aspergillus ambiguus TaxID=176160 RepID=UPI003CCDC0F3